jgi:hypothetical protein
MKPETPLKADNMTDEYADRMMGCLGLDFPVEELAKFFAYTRALRTQLEQAQKRGEAFQGAAKMLGVERNAWKAIAQESNPEVAKAFEQAEARETALRESLEEIERIVTTAGGPQLHMIMKIRDAIARALSGEGTKECLHDDRVLLEVLHYECPDCAECLGRALVRVSGEGSNQ